MWSHIITGIVFLLISFNISYGQMVNTAVFDAFASQSVNQNNEIAAANKVNEKAVRHFNSNYNEVVDEQWNVGKDCYRVSFQEGGVQHIIDYHLNGRLRSKMRIYNETLLPADIRKAVKAAFADSDILLVNEVSFENMLSYFVKLRQDNWCRTIRIVEGQIDLIQEFREQ